ncbi:hypothetical protein [Pontiella agarivorans]|uniref:Autotransporter domain-containing protein n=1 Tax=Pontiella agarivorans TaxID=3038953 RepID=A0ABU5MXK1_9BACT|nr:hypothetical protein [Pontiella agarivorans]MDZ8118801.1 hypothetical protein [Pontiella agarivorans]
MKAHDAHPAIRLFVLTAVLPLVFIPVLQAVPDEPIITNGIAYFEGNQSCGMVWTASTAVPSIVVSNLTADITPSNGTTGIILDDNKESVALSMMYHSNDYIIRTEGNSAMGIMADSGAPQGTDRGTASGGNDGVSGGTGGSADKVSAFIIGAIQTAGTNSLGVLGMSTGGRGGKGGNGGEGFLDDGAGGNGGTGGNGGSVIITGQIAVATSGSISHGIMGLSQGGDGGSGGHGYEDAGGKGGTGGVGGMVSIIGGGLIETSGDGASGIYARSAGGQGGKGEQGHGNADGGNGGYGGHAGSVVVTSTWNIATSGAGSSGIMAISSGGAGGRGESNGSDVGYHAGRGGTGGNAGSVWVTGSGTIETRGTHSSGINALSAGGSGGRGSAGFQSGDGGRGGAGGAGGTVTVNGSWTIDTVSSGSHGISAGSLGGDGNDGGNGKSDSADDGNGGSGGTGANAGDAAVSGNTEIRTQGDGAFGVLVKSVGGRGGNAGEAYEDSGGRGGNGGQGGSSFFSGSGSIETAGNGAYGIYALSSGGLGGRGGEGHGNAHGGDGGHGGSAGNVVMTSNCHIATAGSNSTCILAESIGGAGGSGHSNGKDVGYHSGDGGSGGNAGSIDLTGFGYLETEGTNGAGILAKSKGGAGAKGAGGFQSGNGGTGGSGGAGAEVRMNGNWNVTTWAVASHGISASSLGGQGGDGGGSDKDWLDDGKGADGGLGGNSGNVSVSGKISIATSGEGAYGLLALSEAGNGGNGGTTYDNKDVGGKGRVGGDSGMVTITGSGRVATSGHNSKGLIAVSRAGRGGDGGDGKDWADGGNGAAGGDADAVLVDGNWLISTRGTNSAGISANSFGGSGGTAGAGGWDLFADDGAGGGSGDGANVAVFFKGEIETQGKDSHGIFAQSIGGFGGNAPEEPDEIILISLPAFSGSGGSAGGGGNVNIENYGKILTYGTGSHALFAQSIGGGGGSGIAEEFEFFWGAITIHQDAPQGGNGGRIAISNGGVLQTTNHNSRGIFAQSVGGGGGNVTDSFSLFSNLGGTGGAGGDGGTVSVTNFGRIATAGNNSEAVFAQSIGGGGGTGGGSAAVGWWGSLAIGGTGGKGGDASTVDIQNILDGVISTTGEGSFGIFAQSVGGGGGQGGYATSVSAGNGGSLAVAIGGRGGEGGDGGAVNVDNAASVMTYGNNAHAIIAQSGGGGGGSGGQSIAASVSDKVAGSWSMGGAGEKGGDAGTVTVNSSGSVITDGTHSYGILAQSVGGGGGDGGTSIAGSGAVNGAVAVSIGGLGGPGGFGGNVYVTNSGEIITRSSKKGEVSNFSSNLGPDEVESPMGSAGIFAQSIGGGGGNGGMAFSGTISGGGKSIGLSTAFGGKGGTGNSAGDVMLLNAGCIETSGINSPAIMAQSIGGGGGNGGSAYSFGLTVPITDKAFNLGISSAVGGQGGEGGIGGRVNVMNDGEMTTRGDDSQGIFAQSIGGGGGNGGSSLALSLGLNFTAAGKQLLLTRSLGGEGGEGNYGGSVSVDNNGNILTLGDMSDGILAQSIGGGGGNGGDAQAISLNLGWQSISPVGSPTSILKGDWMVGGDGGSGSHGGVVAVTNRESVQTEGIKSRAIFAQSIGGGGGDGGNGIRSLGPILDAAKFILDTTPYWQNLSFVVGGNGGSSGNAGAVNVWNSGDLVTSNYASPAILAQSVGGGGGIAQDFYKVESTGSGGSAEAGALGKVGIGGAGGSAGDGDRVDVFNSGDIHTGDDESHGIFAQSVGGGGGIAGNVSRVIDDDMWLVGGLDVGLGLDWARDGGCGGNGGNVTITNLGHIETHGIRSFGIFAQSVGGGGGLAGGKSLLADGISYITDFFSGSVGGYGDSGYVRVMNSGDVITYGEASDAIFVQSVGGTNENGKAKGQGEIVQIELMGSAMAFGTNANGVFAQSTGVNGGTNITISISDGVVQGGYGTGTGVHISGGLSNTLANYGVIYTMNGATGTAVKGEAFDESIFNAGEIIGSVDLGGGKNNFYNRESGTFNSGSVINLGAGNLLVNAGTLSPAGVTTLLTGDYMQTTSGVLRFDVNGSAGSDQLVVDGTATLDGTIWIVNGGGVFTNGMMFDVLISSNDLVDTFSHTNLPPAKPLLFFGLEQESDRIRVTSTVDRFKSVAKNPLEKRMGRLLDALIPTAPGDLLDVMAAFQKADSAQYQRAFESLSPAAHGSSSQAAISSARQASGGVRSRMSRVSRGPGAQPTGVNGPDIGDLRTADGRPTGFWMGAIGVLGDQSEKDGYSGYEFTTGGFELGYDRIFESKTILGVSIGYANTGVDLDNDGGDSTIRSIGGTVYGARQADAWYFEGILGYGNQRFDSDRNVTVGTMNEVARSEHDGDLFSLAGKVRYDIDREKWTFSPLVSLYWFHLDEDGFSETGAPGANLMVNSRSSDALLSELGARAMLTILSGEREWKPFLKLSWLHDFDIGDQSLTAAFEGAPNAPFSIEGPEPDNDGLLIGTGFYFMGADRFSAGLGYEAELRKSFNAQYLWGELRFAF